MKPGSFDYWRGYFKSANWDIFEIIDHAIMIAALDCPKEFKLRRGRIAERLFSTRLSRCSGCNRVELVVPSYEGETDDEDSEDTNEEVDIEGLDDGCELEGGVSKESKVNSCTRDNDIDNEDGEVNVNDQFVSNYSYGEAEALTDEIEEESQVLGEVLRIKEILVHSQDQSDSVLFESLTRLQLMALTVDILRTTKIGKAVNGLRSGKHISDQVRQLARTLVLVWKEMVDEWYSAAKAVTVAVDEGTPDSVNPSVVDEDDGLPSPPLEEGAFFATQPAGMELSQFFDGMDDDGNPRNSGEIVKNRECERKPAPESRNIAKPKQQRPGEANTTIKNSRNQQTRQQETVSKPSRPFNAETGPGRPSKPSLDQKAKHRPVQQKPERVTIQRKPVSAQEKLKSSDEISVQKKLEATKRKLQESYQQAENAKRQRTIQVMELHDLPRQGHVQRSQHARPGNHNRHWAQGRR